jgi:hypothetical protein
MNAQEIQAAIEAHNAQLQAELAAALQMQAVANARVKAAREAIAKAVRLHTPRKYPGRKPRALTPADADREFERAEASVELFESRDRGAEHLGAHEFPTFEGSMAGAMAEKEANQ